MLLRRSSPFIVGRRCVLQVRAHRTSCDKWPKSDRELIAWLAAHRSEVWVTTLQGALDWAKAHPDPQQ